MPKKLSLKWEMPKKLSMEWEMPEKLSLKWKMSKKLLGNETCPPEKCQTARKGAQRAKLQSRGIVSAILSLGESPKAIHHPINARQTANRFNTIRLDRFQTNLNRFTSRLILATIDICLQQSVSRLPFVRCCSRNLHVSRPFSQTENVWRLSNGFLLACYKCVCRHSDVKRKKPHAISDWIIINMSENDSHKLWTHNRLLFEIRWGVLANLPFLSHTFRENHVQHIQFSLKYAECKASSYYLRMRRAGWQFLL